MLRTVSQSTPTNQYENVGSGVQDSPVSSTVGNPFTGAMNNLSSVNTDIFQTNSANWNTDIYQTDSSNRNVDLFQATLPHEDKDLFQTSSSNTNIWALSRTPPTSHQFDIFQPLPSDVKTPATEIKSSNPPFEIFQSPPSSEEANIFQKPKPVVPKKPDSLKLRLRNGTLFSQGTPSPVFPVFAEQKPSPVSDTSWPDVFQTPPSETSDIFHTPSSTRDDLFSPFQNNSHDPSSTTSSSVNSDLFKTPSAIYQATLISQLLSSSRATHSPGNPFYPIPNGKAGFGMTEAAGDTVSTHKKLNVLLTTPGGREHDVLQDTPSDVRNGAFSSPSQETEVSTSTPSEFSWPKPLPRVPPQAAPRTKVPINTVKEPVSPVEDECPSDVNVVFTGEERCVEDWPEDSPQHSSDWKPSGTLKLRRESILEKEEGSSRDKGGKKKQKKLGLSISRRWSKDKLVDDLKHGDGHTPHQQSEEGLLIDVFSSDNGEDQHQGEDSKSAKKLKFKGSRVLRKKSKEKLFVGSNTTENHSVLELYEGPVEEKAGSVFSPTTPIIPKDNTQDEINVMPEFASQKKKVLKRRLSNFHQRTLKGIQGDQKNTEDQSLHQDLGALLNETPDPYESTTTWSEKEQEINVTKDIFIPHNGASKDAELDAYHEKGSVNKEQDYYGMELNHQLDHHQLDHHQLDHHQPDLKLDHQLDDKLDHQLDHNQLDHQLDHHEKNFLDEDLSEKDAVPHEEHEEEGPHGTKKKKKKKKKSIKITVPHLTWKHSNNNHPHGYSPGSPSRDYYLPEGAKGMDYESPDAMRSDYYPSASAKEGGLFPALEEKPPFMFSSMGNVHSVREEYGATSSSNYKVDPMEDDFFHQDADVFKEGRYGKADKWRTEEDYGLEFLEDDFPEKCTIHEDDDELNRKEGKPSPGKKKKSRKMKIPHLNLKDRKSKAQQYEDPPGATSSDYYLSDAAKAEWMSSQMDVRRTCKDEEEEKLEGLPEEDEGDTDSLMEWWNTVEMWDEVPSDEESTLKEEESKSFAKMADKVHRGLRVFNKVYMEQAEVLYQHVLMLHAIADNLSNFHHRAKVGSITGGTTMAVGGAAAIAGLALAPLTLGASLVVSAVGLGVVTAGGITSASAAISDKVHDAHDRKKIELVANDYLKRLTEVARCLGYVREGMRRLSHHPLLRRNNYYASSDWEVRRALQMVSLVHEPADRAANIAERGTAALSSLFKHMDRYFVDKGGRQELRKTCKKEATGQVHSVATILQEGLLELNTIREQMLDAYGNI